MSMVSRRQFLATTSLAAGTALLAGRFALAEEPVVAAPAKAKSGTDLVALGKTGIKTSMLGIGTGMTGGSEVRNLGQDAFVRMVREAYDRGIRYIDTALAYRTHPLVAAALKELPRDEMFVLTKTDAKKADSARADIERARKELGVETIDTLMIHCMMRKQWPVDMRPVIDVLLEAKQKGQIRAIGVSCHDLSALADAVDLEAMDVHLVRINPFRVQMEGTPDEVSAQIKRMHENGHGVLGMKIYGEGRFKTRQQRLDSLKYVLGLGTVPAFTIGFADIKQIDETLQLIHEAAA